MEGNNGSGDEAVGSGSGGGGQSALTELHDAEIADGLPVEAFIG